MSGIKNAHIQEQLEAHVSAALDRALGYYSGARGWAAVGTAFGSHLHAAFPAESGWDVEILGDCIGRTLVRMTNGTQEVFLTLDIRAEVQPEIDNQIPHEGLAMVP